MQLTTPKSISITLTFLLLILSTVFYFSFNTLLSQDLKWWIILLLVLLFLWLYYTVAKWFLTNYIHRKVKLIYKSLRREKGASDDVETDLKKVSDEVDELVTERQKEIEELKVMENFRREFLGNVSHELKTPIFNIQGYIHTLIDGALQDEAVNMRYLVRTSKSVDRMINIVEDLEMISKIESNRLDLEFREWDIVNLTQEIFEALEMKSKRRSIVLSIDNQSQNTKVIADKEKISQVLINLIDNSIKYGKEGGHTKVRFFEMGENLLVEVSDNGNGISSHHLPRLFERFYRVDKSRSRNEGGTGLGLAIVKHIIEAHRQTINVRSTVSKGTTFSFTLKNVK